MGRVISTIVNAFTDNSTADVENFEISSPYNFKHTHHVQVYFIKHYEHIISIDFYTKFLQADPHSSTGFSGLPMPMRQVLKASGITKEETSRNPQAVLDVLAFHMDGPGIEIVSYTVI